MKKVKESVKEIKIDVDLLKEGKGAKGGKEE